MASLATLRALRQSHHGLLAAVSLTGGIATFTAAHERLSTKCEAPAQPKESSSLRRRMTPIGHFSILSETPENPSNVTFFLKLRNDQNDAKPLTKERLTQLWMERNMNVLHPRFHQTACNKWPGYFCDESHDAGDHISETFHPVDDSRNDIRRRLQHLQTTPMDLSKSLWHAWIATPRKSRRATLDSDEGAEKDATQRHETFLLFRSHHVLADGASIGAALMDLFDEAEAMRREVREFFRNRRKQTKSWLDRLLHKLKQLYWFVAGSCQAILYQCYCLTASAFSSDPWQMVEQYYRKHSQALKDSPTRLRTIAWAGPVAAVDQVKIVAQSLGGSDCTINHVFVSCVTAALVRLLEMHRKRLWQISGLEHDDARLVLPTQSYMNVTVPVHLKGGIVMPGESVGNALGAFVARLPAEGVSDPVERLQAVHKELHFLKRTPAAMVSHAMATSLSYAAYVLPPTLTSWLYREASAGSVAVVTNVRMSPKPTHIDGHVVESAFGFVPLPPGLPVGVVVASYDGNMYLSVTAEPWAVPDGDDFLRMVLEEYMQLVDKAKV